VFINQLHKRFFGININYEHIYESAQISKTISISIDFDFFTQSESKSWTDWIELGTIMMDEMY